MSVFRRTVIALAFAAVVVAAQVCHDQATCDGVSATEAVRASAMLQLRAEGPGTAVLQSATGPGTAVLQSAHLAESRDCISSDLQEVHLQAIRRHAMVLATERKGGASKVILADEVLKGPPLFENIKTTTEEPTEAPTEEPTEAVVSEAPTAEAMTAPESGAVTGATAELEASGFKAVTKLCCPVEMEQWFIRLLESMGEEVCSLPHVQGLMHWFTCVPDMDFQYMLDVIEKGNPCKFWEKTAVDCPALSEECQGSWCR